MVRGIQADTLAQYFGRKSAGSDAGHSDVIARQTETTALSLQVRESSESTLSLSNEARLAFKLASRSQVSVHEDGSVTATNKTQLRFRYDLLTEDGQQLQLQARAKIKQSAVLDENGDVAIKTRVKLQFSLIQREVAEGVRPLLGDAGDQPGNPLDTFVNVVDQVVSGFADDGNVDADTLIHSVLQEFNLLFGEVSQQTGAGEPPVVIDAPAADDAVETPDVPAQPPVTVAEVGTAVESATDVAVVENAVAAAESSNEASEADAEAAEADVAEVEAAEAEASETGEVEVDDAVEETSEVSEESGEVDAPVSAESAREVLTEVRIRFVQSFYGVIRTLTPGAEGDGASLTQVQQSNIRFAAHLQYREGSAQDPATSFLA